MERAEAGDLNAAEEAFRRADEAGHATAAALLGLLLERRGERTQAAEAYERADQQGSGFGAFRLGLLLSQAEDWEAANEAWARADERGQEPEATDLHARLTRTPNPPDRAAAAGGRSAFANPVMVGAVTILAVLVAVLLAYNANQGCRSCRRGS